MTTFSRRTDWVDKPILTTPVHAADLLRIENGVYHALDTTDTSTQNINSHLTFASTKKIQLYANDITGSVQRLVEFHSTNAEDRPWLSWFDENTRHVCASGYHTKLADSLGGDILKQFEVKTIASSGGPNPTDLRTRFAIQCDVERGTWGVNYIDNFEINQAENPLLTTPGSIVPAGMRIRLAPNDTATAGSGTVVCGQFLVQIDASDNVQGFLDVLPPYLAGGTIPGNRTATLSIFRNTHTASASQPQLAVKKGDGTNTNSLLFTAPSGLFELPLALSGSTGIKLGADASATLYRSAAATIKTDAALAVAGNLGVNGTAPVAKPTVTGAKGSNAALGSLLTALASYGLITDSTTA
ncbi:MAG TPA: hypothetical protein VNF91_01485 [Candidatus Acidoferrum sp.]|nr:hypothetical protein [Candidatus Acidoferrum sp.]